MNLLILWIIWWSVLGMPRAIAAKPVKPLRALPCTNTSEIPSFDPIQKSISCVPLSPSHGMAAMKWLVTPTTTCPGMTENILDKFPTCSMWQSSMAQKGYCLIVIIEDIFSSEDYCQNPSMDLVWYWIHKGCKVRYVASGLPRVCKGNTRRHFATIPYVLYLKRFPWSANTSDTVDILYVVDRFGEGSRAFAEFLTVGKWTPKIDQFVIQLDYTCSNARGPGNDLVFPGWIFYHLYYYQSGGDISFGKFENMGTVRVGGDEVHHSRCFKGLLLLIYML